MKYVGLDWGSREHAVCVVDESGSVIVQFTIEHSSVGMNSLVERLAKIAPMAELRIAIERPTGLLVDTLVDRGFTVVPLHPNAVGATRARYSQTLRKSDLGDAYLLADVLRTDGHRFRELVPLSDQTKALRGLVRTRDDLVAQRVALANQLRSLLQEFWPGGTALFWDVDSPIALDFLERFPTPRSAEGLTEKRLAAFLARHCYSGRRTAAELVERLRNAPASLAGELESDAKGECVRALVAALRPIVERIVTLTSAIEHAVEVHADAQIVTPLFKTGARICAAQILAELGDDRARFVSADHFAADAGAVPVTRESGKHRAVMFRWACNKRLRGAMCTLANITRKTNPWARAIYERAIARGCKHAHAIRIVARAWCRVLWTSWQQRVAYDPAKHRAARAFNLQLVDRELEKEAA